MRGVRLAGSIWNIDAIVPRSRVDATGLARRISCLTQRRQVAKKIDLLTSKYTKFTKKEDKDREGFTAILGTLTKPNLENRTLATQRVLAG